MFQLFARRVFLSAARATHNRELVASHDGPLIRRPDALGEGANEGQAASMSRKSRANLERSARR